jgi:hypothetical protein
MGGRTCSTTLPQTVSNGLIYTAYGVMGCPVEYRIGFHWRMFFVAIYCHSQLSSSLGELAINALVEGLTLAVFIVTFIRSTNK